MNEKQKEAFRRAGNLFRAKNYAAALQILNELQFALPDDAEVLHAKASCMLALRRWDEARVLAVVMRDQFEDPRAERMLETIATRTRKEPSTKSARRFDPRTVRRALAVSAGSVFLLALGAATYLLWNALYQPYSFPVQESMGLLFVAPPGQDPPEWEANGSARGTRWIRRGHRVKLVVGGEDASTGALVHLPFLDKMDEHAFHALVFKNVPLDDDGINSITHFSSLETLDLRGTQVTSLGVLRLPWTMPLVSLDLGDTRVGDDALEWLGDFPRLEDLAIDGTRVTSEGLSAIEDLAAIRSLRLPATARDETLRRLRDRTGIEQLDAQAAAIGDEGLRELRQLTRLKTLDLRGTLITDRGLPHLRPLEALENLGLAETRVTDKGLSYLGELERLATVDLRGTLIDDAGIRSVQRWSELTRVSMGRCCLSGAVTAQSIVGLGALRNLASLHVHGAHLTDSDVEAFSALPIRELNISQTRMTSAGAEALQRLLPEARIAVNDSHGPVAVFPAEQSFGRLFIRSDDAPQADWIPFGEAKGLIHLPEHHEVRLAWDSGNDRFATLSDTTLERITSLKVLSESEDLGSALEQLGRLRNLTELDLSGIEIPSAVLDSLRLPESLNILRYRNGHVTTQWIAHAAALPHITELDLSLSELNPQAQRDLAALAGRLTALHLAGVELESTFLDDIPAQTALEYVDLEGAEIDGSTVRDFQERRPRVRIRPPQSPHRMLRFPDAAPSGEIWWRLPDPRGLAAWRYIGNAMGEVSVPVQSEVRLAVLQDAHEPFRHVNEWPENSLHSLSLVGRTVSAGELRAIAGLASLRRLDLSGGDLPLDALHHLASLTSIEVLAFADTALDNDVLANMGAFPALRALDLSDTVVSDISTDTLLSIASLRYLHLEGTRFTDEGVGVLRRGLPDTFVSFRPRNPSARASAQPDPVFRFPEIPLPGVLFIQSPDSRQGEWEEVGRICCGLAVDARTRRKLVVSARDANDLSAFNLLPPNAFHEIVFEGSPHIGATGLAPIRNLADLEAIRMISATIEPGALAPIADLAHLSTVQLYAARLDDDDLAYLRGLTQLTDLDLTAASVTDDALRHVATVETLERLDVRNNTNITDAGVRHVARIETLRELDLSRTRAGNGSSEPLRGMTSLKRLRLYDSPMDSDALVATADALGLPADEVTHASVTPVDLDLTRPDAESLASLVAEPSPAQVASLVRVAAVHDIAAEDRGAFQSLVLSAMADSDTGITVTRMAAVGGGVRFEQIPGPERSNLQRLTLSAMADSETGITIESLATVANVADYRAMPSEERQTLQRLALSAMAESATGITTQGLAAVAGARSYAEIPPSLRDALQRGALDAMARSRGGISADDLAQLAGVSKPDALSADERDRLQRMALSAMANSDTGITTDTLVTLEGALVYEDVPPERRRALQQAVLDAIVERRDEIDPGILARLGGRSAYTDLPPGERHALQRMALSSMVRSDIEITSPRLARVGGAESLAALDTGQLHVLQEIVFDLLARSVEGIRKSTFAVVTGRNSERDIPDQELSRLRRAAFRAIADQDGMISRIALARIAGSRDLDQLSMEELQQIRSDAMAGASLSSSATPHAVIEELTGLPPVTAVSFAGSDITAERLRAWPDREAWESVDLTRSTAIEPGIFTVLAESSNLRRLNLSGASLPVDGLAELARLTALTHLNLDGTNVTDETMQVLAKLPNLQSLSLAATPITDAGMHTVGRIETLTDINLSRTAVTDDGLETLREHPALVEVIAERTRLDRRGLMSLASIPNLSRLDLSDCLSIESADLAVLVDAEALQWLSLMGVPIGDEAVDDLTKMEGLAYLNVRQTDMSEPGIRALRSGLPGCEIDGAPHALPESRMERRREAERLRIAAQEARQREQAQRALTALQIFQQRMRFIYIAGLGVAILSLLVVPFAPLGRRLGTPALAAAGQTVAAARAGGKVARFWSVFGLRWFMYFFRYWFIIAFILVFLLLFVYLLQNAFDRIAPG